MSTTVTNTVTINADPDDVWAVLAHLPATRWWLPGVVAARMDGDARVCSMADGQEIHERISDLSPRARSFQFDQVRRLLPVSRLEETFTVAAAATSRTAIVELRTSFDPATPGSGVAVAGMIDTAFGQALDGLRRYVEEKVTWDAS